MLKSDRSPVSTSRVTDSSHKKIESLMSSFMVKTSKPWTYVDGPGLEERRPSRHNETGELPSPYLLGARRASAHTDKAVVESYGLVPNHHFKAPRTLHPPPTPHEASALMTKMIPSKWISMNTSVENGKKRINSSPIENKHKKARSSSLPAGSSSPISESETPKRSLTFHCLEFDAGSLRPVSRVSTTQTANNLQIFEPKFIQSEYMQRTGPQQAEATLEAAQLLLDLTRSLP